MLRFFAEKFFVIEKFLVWGVWGKVIPQKMGKNVKK